MPNEAALTPSSLIVPIRRLRRGEDEFVVIKKRPQAGQECPVVAGRGGEGRRTFGFKPGFEILPGNTSDLSSVLFQVMQGRAFTRRFPLRDVPMPRKKSLEWSDAKSSRLYVYKCT